jgi:hypothetical protein
MSKKKTNEALERAGRVAGFSDDIMKVIIDRLRREAKEAIPTKDIYCALIDVLCFLSLKIGDVQRHSFEDFSDGVRKDIADCLAHHAEILQSLKPVYLH